MDASEYKNYLLGLIFYKYLSDKLLEKVVELNGDSLAEYDTAEKQTSLYRALLADNDTRNDLIETLVDTLKYDIEPDFLFSALTDQAQKKHLFNYTVYKKHFPICPPNMISSLGCLMM